MRDQISLSLSQFSNSLDSFNKMLEKQLCFNGLQRSENSSLKEMAVWVCMCVNAWLLVCASLELGWGFRAIIILLVSVLRGHFTRCCPCHLKEKMESRGRTSLEPDKYHCKIWFESGFLWALERQRAWMESVEREGFVWECWYMGNISLKANEKTKLRNLPTEQGRESPQGKLWACSVFVLSCNGRPYNLLRQVARLGGNTTALGAGQRVEKCIWRQR